MYGNKQLLFLCTQGTLLFFLAEVQKQSQSHLSGNCLMQRRHPSNPVFRKQRHGCDYFPHVERMTDSSSRSPLCIYFGKLLFFPLQLSMASCATNGGLWGKKLYYRWRASASFPPPCLAVFTATPDVTESWPSTRYLQKCCWFRILHPQWGSLLRPLTPTSHTHNAWWLTGDHARYSRVVANSCYSFYSGFGIFIFFFYL